MKDKLVFLDRDGVLNIDKAYLYKIEELEWIDGAREAVAYLNSKGYTVVVVTNQSGIARGYYTVNDMEKLHEYMGKEIEHYHGKIDKFYYCPHLADGIITEYAFECDCRKPKPGMLFRVMRDYNVDKEKSFLIGDNKRDVEAAENAGIKGFLFQEGNLLDFIKNIVQ